MNEQMTPEEWAMTPEGRAVLEAIRTSAEQKLVHGLNAVSLAAWIVDRLPRNGYEVRPIEQAAEVPDREAGGGVRALSGATSAAAEPKKLWAPEYNDVFDVLDAALLEHQKRVVERIKRGLDQIEWAPWYDHVDDVLDRESERPIRWPR